MDSQNPSSSDPYLKISIEDIVIIPDLDAVIKQETSLMSSWDRLAKNPVIENTETVQFCEVNASIVEHAKKSAIAIEKSPISSNMQEALIKMKGDLNLKKSASSANKSMSPSKQSMISTFTAVEKILVSARTKAPS